MENTNKDKLLTHYIEEWRYLNEYINRIDLGYNQTFFIVLAVFSLEVALFDKGGVFTGSVMLIIPPGILAIFAFLSYQFRIVAIIRGHLAAIEDEMNAILEKDVYLWNSALVEMYMANNNIINNWMMAPMLFLVVITTVMCIYSSWIVFFDVLVKRIIWGVYWIIIIVFSVIVFVPFVENEKIRREIHLKNDYIFKYKKEIITTKNGISRKK